MSDKLAVLIFGFDVAADEEGSLCRPVGLGSATSPGPGTGDPPTDSDSESSGGAGDAVLRACSFRPLDAVVEGLDISRTRQRKYEQKRLYLAKA